MKKNKKRILITGGMGFIGHNLAISLKKDNYPVKIIDSLQINNLISLKTSPEEYPNPKITKKFLMDRLKLIKQKKIIFDKIDARDYHKLCKSVDKFNPDVVIHLAAVSHADKSNKTPHTTFDHSLRTLENALDATKNKNVHFIYFSSSMVYGNFTDGTKEDGHTKPVNIYGEAKLAGERITKLFSRRHGLNYNIVRPSGVYGPGDMPDRVVSRFFAEAMQDKTITLHNGDNKVDLTYVQDAADGIIKASFSEVSNTSFNITTGNATSLRTLAETIIEMTGSKSDLKDIGMQELYPQRGTLDISRAKDLLDYRPQFTLEEGLTSYYNWLKNFNGI